MIAQEPSLILVCARQSSAIVHAGGTMQHCFAWPFRLLDTQQTATLRLATCSKTMSFSSRKEPSLIHECGMRCRSWRNFVQPLETFVWVVCVEWISRDMHCSWSLAVLPGPRSLGKVYAQMHWYMMIKPWRQVVRYCRRRARVRVLRAFVPEAAWSFRNNR